MLFETLSYLIHMLSKSFYMQYLAKMCCLVSDMLNVCADLTPTPLLWSFLNSIFSIIPSLCLSFRRPQAEQSFYSRAYVNS